MYGERERERIFMNGFSSNLYYIKELIISLDGAH